MSFEMTRATRRNTPAMVETLAAAFVDEPAMCWLLDCDATERHRRLRFFFRPIVSGAIANGIALRSPNDEAITLWRTPGKIHPGLFELLSAHMFLIGSRRDDSSFVANILDIGSTEARRQCCQPLGVLMKVLHWIQCDFL